MEVDKRKRCAHKVTLKRPFDKVDWDFLDGILEAKGFGKDGGDGLEVAYYLPTSLSLSTRDLEER